MTILEIGTSSHSDLSPHSEEIFGLISILAGRGNRSLSELAFRPAKRTSVNVRHMVLPLKISFLGEAKLLERARN